MKRFISIVLLLGFMLQTFSKVLIYVHYEFNKTAITEKYCENKQKPGLSCHGKCHVMKQIKEADKKENSPASNSKDKFELPLFAGSETQWTLQPLADCSILSWFYVVGHSNAHLSRVFQPPTC